VFALFYLGVPELIVLGIMLLGVLAMVAIVLVILKFVSQPGKPPRDGLRSGCG
jgi:hypothetical protein